jgi:hypothetical protein
METSTPGCHKDSECDSGLACTVGRCVPKLAGKQTWILEVLPKAESQWALTEFPAVTFSPDPLQLRVERKTTVEGDVTGVEAASVPMAAVRVLLSFASVIGRGARPVEGPVNRSGDGLLHFSLGVPESALGHEATIRIVPTPPADRLLPGWSVLEPALGNRVTVPAPKPADVALIEGTLKGAFDDEIIPPYLARALMGDRLVSNVERTDDQGRFKLRVPNGAADGVKLEEVTLELAPVDLTTGRPRLLTKAMPGKPNLIRLPAAPQQQAMDIPVTAMGTARVKIPSVTLVFYAPLPGAVGADAWFRREFQTDKEGVARVSLVPGNAGDTRDYAVAVIPPPNSEYAARCLTTYAVASAPAGQTRVGASIELPKKLELTGQVLDAGGAPQSGVMVTAMRKDSTYVQECAADVGSPQSTATTGADGTYRLLLEAGTYRFDYEPPLGSSGALFAEDDVSVTTSQTRKVTMPGGLLADGMVATPQNAPAAGCEVRAYAPGRDGRLELRARARSAEDGTFRILLPRVP